MLDELRFRTIDLSADTATCIAFRRDSFICSFGNDAGFETESGVDGSTYVAWLRSRIETFPEGHLHVWRRGKIIGQLEMIVMTAPQRHGYVNLFYLVPEVRGTGLGEALHQHAEAVFRARGVTCIRLSVSPTNNTALRYYSKHGWKDLGPRPDAPHVRLMELSLT